MVVLFCIFLVPQTENGKNEYVRLSVHGNDKMPASSMPVLGSRSMDLFYSRRHGDLLVGGTTWLDKSIDQFALKIPPKKKVAWCFKLALSVSPAHLDKPLSWTPRLAWTFFSSPSLLIQVGQHLLRVQLELWMQSSAIQVSLCFKIAKLD